MRRLPPILHPPDGVTAREMALSGWQRQARLRASEQLRVKHAYGHHDGVIASGCPSCGREVSLFMLRAFEPRRDVMEFFA